LKDLEDRFALVEKRVEALVENKKSSLSVSMNWSVSSRRPEKRRGNWRTSTARSCVSERRSRTSFMPSSRSASKNEIAPAGKPVIRLMEQIMNNNVLYKMLLDTLYDVVYLIG
jgi:hypothetical protein